MTAISAWDGEISYGVLNALASRLATQLISLGVGPDVIVPLCFEKSMWTTVAVLAVLKAGAAFTLLDPSQPIARVRDIIEQTQAKVMMCSSDEAPKWSAPGMSIVIVGTDWFAENQDARVSDLATTNRGSPDAAAYIVFTSGSTGTPKGVIVTHNALSSAIAHQAGLMGYGTAGRVFEFSSYAFDMAIETTFFSLATGACLCVPSDSARKDDLTKAVVSMGADYLKLTPSVTRMLDRRSIPTVRTIVLGGEEIREDDLLGWESYVRVIKTYGPAECSPVSTIEPKDQELGKDITIGYGAGAVTWIVDTSDVNQLVPIGAVGELCIEGPIVGQGYLHDDEKTAAAFIEDPLWLTRGSTGHPGRRGRLYKTGDLVRYSEDGSLVFVGRKDTQVKIHGQRVELAEVESHTLACLPNATQVAAEVITPSGDGADSMLAAFVVRVNTNGEVKTSKISAPSNSSDDAQVITLSTATEDALAERLPSYMMPTVLFAIDSMPVNSSGKTDRKKLREIGSSFSAQQLADMRADATTPKKAPTTLIQRALQQLWARILSLDPASIGLDDSFFRLGGDSILAMKLVALARQDGYSLSVADIFRGPKLSEMAHAASEASSASTNGTTNEIPAFSLLPHQRVVDQFRESAAATCQVDLSDIEDAYPCTPLQKVCSQ